MKSNHDIISDINKLKKNKNYGVKVNNYEKNIKKLCLI